MVEEEYMKKKIISNISGLSLYLLVDFLIGNNYDFFTSISRGLVFLVLFNVFEWMVRRATKKK